MKKDIVSYLLKSRDTVHDTMIDERILANIERAAKVLIEAIGNNNNIIAIGNGGSMTDAMHFASELTGRYKNDREPIAAIAISDVSHLTCVSNDYDYAAVFSRWVMAHGKPGDVLLAISTSGKSLNVWNAVAAALTSKGMKVIALSGKDGGNFKFVENNNFIEIRIPSHDTGMIQQLHITIIHTFCELIEANL